MEVAQLFMEGFHIGDNSGYYYPAPPAHQPPPYNTQPQPQLIPPQNTALEHPLCQQQQQQQGNHHMPPPPGYGMDSNDMDIKVEPDMMDSYPSPESSLLSQGSSPSGSPQSAEALRARKNKEDKVCGVCGDRALGYNFDAISCESCKAFFRRNAPKSLDYFKCPYDEKCKMDISNRRFCKRCRLKKCFEIGMRKEYILTDEEKQRKRAKIEENRCKTVSADCFSVVKDLERCGIIKHGEVTSQTIAMQPEDAEAVDELIGAFQSSLEVQVEKDNISRQDMNSLSDLMNIAELSVRRIIDMAKKIKSFKALPQADQISLLKGGSIELLVLRSVLSFDKEKQHYLDPNDSEEAKAVSLDKMKYVENGSGLFEDHIKFIKSLAIDLRADETTMILLLVISLFSPDRGNLISKEEIGEQQERYSMLLKKYLESKYPVTIARNMYPKLLMKLTDIRNLNEEHSQVILKVNPGGIRPLMQEVLDLH